MQTLRYQCFCVLSSLQLGFIVYGYCKTGSPLVAGIIPVALLFSLQSLGVWFIQYALAEFKKKNMAKVDGEKTS